MLEAASCQHCADDQTPARSVTRSGENSTPAGRAVGVGLPSICKVNIYARLSAARPSQIATLTMADATTNLLIT
jgi:hypothetical protein